MSNRRKKSRYKYSDVDSMLSQDGTATRTTDFPGPLGPTFFILSASSRLSDQAGQMHVARWGLFHVASMAILRVRTTFTKVTVDCCSGLYYPPVWELKIPNIPSNKSALQHLDSEICTCLQDHATNCPANPIAIPTPIPTP